MNAIFSLFGLLAIPLAILNLLGGLVSGIWLAVLGDWGSIGYGLLAMFISIFVLSVALVLSILLTGPGAYFANKGMMFPFYVFAFLGHLYTAAIITIWCGGVLYFFSDRATTESFIPVLIWSYGVALGPWQWMTQKEIEGGRGEKEMVTTFFAQIGYVVMVLMALFWSVTIVDVLTAFIIVMLVDIIFELFMTIQAMSLAQVANQDYDEPPHA
ncbi:MAG: hypothetical protein U5R46_12680 [Gammaproteobacteria bacterium]|nr:hypothetical protein [Gammaproteobacteria bacterium]